MDEVEDVFGDVTAIGSETTEAEKSFDRVLGELREMEGMKLISDVYTKLYDSYHKLKESNLEHLKEIAATKTKLDRFDDTVNRYEMVIKNANAQIQALKEELCEAREMADAMHTRELNSVEGIDSMRRLVTRLEKQLEARKKEGDEDTGGTNIAKEREKFEKEKLELNNEIDSLRNRNKTLQEFNLDFEEKVHLAELAVEKLEEQLEDANNSAVRQNRMMDLLKVDLDDKTKEVTARGIKIKKLKDKLAQTEENLEKLEAKLQKVTHKLESSQADHEAMVQRSENYKRMMDQANTELDNVRVQLTDLSKQLKLAFSDGNHLRTEMSKIHNQNVMLEKRYQNLTLAKNKVESEREILRQQIHMMDRDIMIGKRNAENDKREIENLRREINVMSQSIQKLQLEAVDNLTTLNIAEGHRKQLDREIEGNVKLINKQRLLIRQFEKDKDRLLEDAMALNEKIDQICEEVRQRDADLVDLKKALNEESQTSRKLSVALDTCRTEKNILNKNYTEALDEMQDIKQKYKMVVYQLEQLKEDSSAKELALRHCESVYAKCVKKTELLTAEVLSLHTRLAEARAEIFALRQEEARLNKSIREADVIRGKLQKELEGMLNERDVLGAQLVRRNDEIKLLYEKIHIMEVTLHSGSRAYECRVDDIRLLRLEIIRLRKEKNLLSKGIENMTDLRLEVFNLERELARERLRVRALEQALETPLNVHRWRKLQSTDPDFVMLAQKLSITQKKVVYQSDLLVKKDRELKQTQNLYGAVKETLALQPSPQIQQTLSKTQRALANRTKKIKCLIAEVNVRENKISELTLDMNRLSKDLVSYKQRYYEMKRALDADEARRLRVPSPPSVPQ